MRLNIDAAALLRFIEGNPDAEGLGRDEYVVDIYDTDRPATLEISIKGDKVFAQGAAYLEYDPELDGWYMADVISSAKEIVSLLNRAMEAHG